MTTLTELVAAVVVHSSAVAFSHFCVVLDTPKLEQPVTPASERVVARSHPKVAKLANCPARLRVHGRGHALKT